VAGEFDFANVGRLSSRDVEKDIDLLVGGVGGAFGGDARAVIAVLLHELANVLHGAVELVESMKFAELKLGSIHDLVGVGMAGSAFYVDGPDKEIKGSSESEHHTRAGGSDFGLDIGEASGGEQQADAFSDLVAVEGLARFLGKHLEQVVAVRHAGQFDGLDCAAGVSRHGA